MDLDLEEKFYSIHLGTDDLFGHFKTLAAKGKLPEFEDLEVLARKLYRAYSTTRGIYHALHGTETKNEWSDFVPLGTPWNPSINQSSTRTAAAPTQSKSTKKNRSKKKKNSSGEPSTTEPFKGDRTLAKSIALRRDLLWQREMAYATAEGDVGRLYEIMKVRFDGV